MILLTRMMPDHRLPFALIIGSTPAWRTGARVLETAFPQVVLSDGGREQRGDYVDRLWECMCAAKVVGAWMQEDWEWIELGRFVQSHPERLVLGAPGPTDPFFMTRTWWWPHGHLRHVVERIGIRAWDSIPDTIAAVRVRR